MSLTKRNPPRARRPSAPLAPRIIRRFNSKRLSGTVWQGDGLAFLQTFQDETVDLVFLDPPFNLGKSYGEREPHLDRKPSDHYEHWLKNILFESVRILRKGGSLYLYHLPRYAMKVGHYLERYLDFQHWIAVSMKNGFVRGDHLYPAHYALVYFTKGNPSRFKRPKLRPVLCRHCGEMIKDYGGYKDIIDKKGINLSDFWDDLSPVRHKNRKHRISNELPLLMMKRILEISGGKNLAYVDPFAGSGTGVVAAASANMKFEACDLVKSSCEIICKRLDSFNINNGSTQ